MDFKYFFKHKRLDEKTWLCQEQDGSEHFKPTGRYCLLHEKPNWSYDLDTFGTEEEVLKTFYGTNPQQLTLF